MSTIVKSRTHTVVADILVADIQAGFTVLPAVAGRAYVITKCTVTATGTASGATGVLVEDTAASPVVIGEIAAAGMVSATEYSCTTGAAQWTAGAGWQAPVTANCGVKVIADGTLGTTTTAKFVLDYLLVVV